MTYPELRRRLRAEGFINHEIAILHHQYLAVTALGVADADIAFDHDHGMLIHQRASRLLEAAIRANPEVVIDVENHAAHVRFSGQKLH